MLEIQLNTERAVLATDHLPDDQVYTPEGDTGFMVLEFHLTLDELHQLRNLSNQAYLASIGFEEHSITAGDLEPGDVIETLGQTVSVVQWGGMHVKVWFEGLRFYLELVADMPLKVNRKIQ